MPRRVLLISLILVLPVFLLCSADPIELGIRDSFATLMDTSTLNIEIVEQKTDETGLFEARVKVQGMDYYLAAYLDTKKDCDKQIRAYCEKQFCYEASQILGYDKKNRIDIMEPLACTSLEGKDTLLDAISYDGTRVGVLNAVYQNGIAKLNRVWASDLKPGTRLQKSSLIGLDLRLQGDLESLGMEASLYTPIAPFFPAFAFGWLYDDGFYMGIGLGYALALDPLFSLDFILLSNARIILQADIGLALNTEKELYGSLSIAYQHYLNAHFSWGLEFTKSSIAQASAKSIGMFLGVSL